MFALIQQIEHLIGWCTQRFPEGSYLSYDFNLASLIAVVLASFVCGAVGSLVVGNRMAFFSDALAHCAFAGISLGFLFGYFTQSLDDEAFHAWGVPGIMVVFGIMVGLAIAYVREASALSSDSVIGVFFAGAIGFGSMILKAISKKKFFNPEGFLFGDVNLAQAHDLLILAALAVVTMVVLGLLYNQIVFTSFNPSLARSRRIPVRLCSYVLVILLALIVNLCLKTVGVLLINALLIVPAATAANLARNLRQMFWINIGICLLVGVLGHWLSWVIRIPLKDTPNDPLQFGSGGMIIVLSVVLFFLTLLWAGYRRRSTPVLAADSGRS